MPTHFCWMKESKPSRDKIVELNLDENTLIIFMPDHGMWRHGKATLHDYGSESSHVYVLERKNYCRFVYDGLVQTVDFLPTILDLAGIDHPAGLETDGMSLKSIIETGNGESPFFPVWGTGIFQGSKDQRLEIYCHTLPGRCPG